MSLREIGNMALDILGGARAVRRFALLVLLIVAVATGLWIWIRTSIEALQ